MKHRVLYRPLHSFTDLKALKASLLLPFWQLHSYSSV